MIKYPDQSLTDEYFKEIFSDKSKITQQKQPIQRTDNNQKPFKLTQIYGIDKQINE